MTNDESDRLLKAMEDLAGRAKKIRDIKLRLTDLEKQAKDNNNLIDMLRLSDELQAVGQEVVNMQTDSCKTPEGEYTAVKDSGARTQYATGAVRDKREGKGRYDLIPTNILRVMAELLENGKIPHIDACIKKFADVVGVGRFDLIPSLMIQRLAKHYENGAKKYGDHNWQKGIPLHCYLDSCFRHLVAVLEGKDDEDHMAAVIWNMAGYMWTKDKIDSGALPKELDDVNKT